MSMIRVLIAVSILVLFFGSNSSQATKPKDLILAENTVINAFESEKVIEILKRKMANGKKASTKTEQISLALQNIETQVELFKQLKPIFSKAPYDWPDSQISEYILSVSKNFKSDLNEAYLSKKTGDKTLDFDSLSKDQWKELYMVFVDMTDKNKSIIVNSLVRQEDKKIENKDKGVAAMLDDKVQKTLTKEMSSLLSAAPYFWTTSQIKEFIQSASIIYGNKLGAIIEKEYPKK